MTELHSTPAEAKDAAQDVLKEVAAAHQSWMAKAKDWLRGFPPGMEGTFEDFRVALTAAGFPKPRHHNAWGALANALIRRGWLEATGEMRHMLTRAAHGRRTPVYQLRRPQ